MGFSQDQSLIEGTLQILLWSVDMWTCSKSYPLVLEKWEGEERKRTKKKQERKKDEKRAIEAEKRRKKGGRELPQTFKFISIPETISCNNTHFLFVDWLSDIWPKTRSCINMSFALIRRRRFEQRPIKLDTCCSWDASKIRSTSWSCRLAFF